MLPFLKKYNKHKNQIAGFNYGLEIKDEINEVLDTAELLTVQFYNLTSITFVLDTFTIA